ncbi:acyltransferase family protein [Blastopirellula marina]|uniref:Acyltransferase 3 domain-containing protein n=1 Tax=Blastopirellula marina TaxID=124 RepID=A0A2S8F9D1_9BACT|nr:acyltransferase [Blastopirellula marina]PQO28769.1 hypothetical protein C5Y98_23605 [Blastopirellula marina]PTL42042.1 acyltransferase [Blastopirellula marina]
MNVAVTNNSESEPRHAYGILGFDVLRFVAVLAVIWFHARAPGSDYTLWHVPTLVIISVVLASEYHEHFSMEAVVRKRAKRILIPWLFWCVVYGVVDIVRVLFGSPSLVLGSSYFVFLYGPSLHLWFLPYIFLVTVFAACLRNVVIKESKINRAAVALLILVVALWALYVLDGQTWWKELPMPLLQWFSATPAMCLGVLLALLVPFAVWFSKDSRYSLIFVGSGLISCLIAATLPGLTSFSLVALGLVLLASTWKGSRTQGIGAFLASITMGVYLVHPTLITISRMCLAPRYEASVLHAVLAILLSVLIASLLVRSPLRQVV